MSRVFKLANPMGAFTWTYAPADGWIVVNQTLADGSGCDPTFTYRWDTGFDTMTGFTLAGAGYVWAYRPADGRVVIMRIAPDGRSMEQRHISAWDAGFSVAAGFELAGRAYVWAYRPSDGTVCIHRIDDDGAGFTQASQTTWDTGFDVAVAMTIGDRPYIWAYRPSDGIVCIHVVEDDGRGFEQRLLQRWDTGFAATTSVSIAGAPYVWAYRATDGRVCIHAPGPEGRTFEQRYDGLWDAGFDQVCGLAASPGLLWAERPADGLLAIHQVNPDGHGFTQRWLGPLVKFDRATLDQVVRRYAPVERFYAGDLGDEAYLPSSVEWLLARATLVDAVNHTRIVHPTSDQLPSGGAPDQYYLDIESDAKPGDLGGAVVYVVAKVTTPGTTDIEYWLCYPYNGPGTVYVSALKSGDVGMAPLGEHWGDWEHVTARVDTLTGELVGVEFSQHDGSQWIDDIGSLERRGDQLVVYPSRNGHASYPHPSDNLAPDYTYVIPVFDHRIGVGLRNDTAAGRELDGQARHLLIDAPFVGADRPTPPNWYEYPYRWGPNDCPDIHATEEQVKTIIASALPQFLLGWAFLVADLVYLVAGGAADEIAAAIYSDNLNGPHGPKR